MNKEIIELQTRLAFQEDTIGVLSKALARQQKELDRMGLDISKLQQQMRTLVENAAPEVEETPPPHY